MHPNAGRQWNPIAFPLPVRVIREATLRLPREDGALETMRPRLEAVKRVASGSGGLGHVGPQRTAGPPPRSPEAELPPELGVMCL